MWCGYLEQVERGAHCVVDADEDGDVGQSLCSKAVFGLPVERLVDTVSGGKLPRQLCGDLLVLTEVIWYFTACQYPDGVVISFQITFSGFEPFFDSFNYFAVQLTDFKGNKSNVGICDLDDEKAKGESAMRGVPLGSVPSGSASSEEPLDIDLGPRRY